MQDNPYEWQEDVFQRIQLIDGPFHMTVKAPRQSGKSMLAEKLRDRLGWRCLSTFDTQGNIVRFGMLTAAQSIGKQYNGTVLDELRRPVDSDVLAALKDCKVVEIQPSEGQTEVEIDINCMN
jgi:hypothetical protein